MPYFSKDQQWLKKQTKSRVSLAPEVESHALGLKVFKEVERTGGYQLSRFVGSMIASVKYVKQKYLFNYIPK